MKSLLFSLCITFIFYSSLCAQDLLPQQVSAADAIVEGEIVSQSSFWNPDRTFIYTKNTVRVYKVFKGSLPTETVDIVSLGGQVGDKLIKHSGIMPHVGDAGVFFAQQKSNQYEEVHGSFIIYDKLQKKGFSSTGTLYESVENEVYRKIKQATKADLQVKDNASLFYETKPKSNGRVEAINVESLVPATVTAGTRTKLTINGSGFGATRGTNGNVLFSDAATGGATLRAAFFAGVNQPDLISWSDTKIEVYVPSYAGTGGIAVVNNNNEEFRTVDKLTVDFSLLTVFSQGIRPNANLVNSNTKGGYTLFISSEFFENRAVLGILSDAVTTWRCETSVNIEMSELQTNIGFGSFGVSSVIIFNNLQGGLLADVFSQYTACNIGAGNNWRLQEFQMVINLQALQRANIDLGTQFLALLGKASQLGAVNDPKDLMYFKLNAMERKTIGAANKRAINQILMQSAIPNDCGTQPMQPTTANDCKNSIQAPIARFSSDKTALCDNGIITFRDESRNAIGLQWTFAGGNPATSTDKNPKVTYANAGTYDVVMTVTNPAGMNVSEKKNYIVVGKSGQLKVDLKDTVICQGNMVRLDAGNAGATYLWSNGATTQSIEVKNANTYTVTVTKDGCAVTGSAKVSFQNSPVDAGASLQVCVGQTGQLNATAATAISYTWTPATGLSNPNIPNPTVKPTRTTVYYLAVNTGNRCGIIRDSVLVSVVPPPVVNLPDTTTFCGTMAGFLVADNGLLGGMPPAEGVTYKWNTGATTPFLNVNTGGKYFVTATSREGCIVNDTTFVKFVQALKASVTPNGTICQGGQMQLNASGGQTYRWQPATGLSDPTIPNPVASPSVTTTYTVFVVANQFGGGGGQGCQPVTAQVTVTVVPKLSLNLGKEITTCETSLLLDTKIASATYLWSDGSKNQTLRVTKSGTYKITVTPTSVCKDILIDSVKVNFITLDLGKTVISCNKEITLDAKIPNATYLWSDGSKNQTLKVTKSGKYKVSVTLPNCNRILVDSANVFLPDLNIGNERDSMRACKTELVLDAGNAVPNVEYLWSDGSKNQTLKVTKEGWYKVMVNRKDCNLSLRDSIYVSFFKVDLGKDIASCAPFVTLDAGNSGAKYLWTDAKKSTSRTLRVTESGVYGVTVTDTCGAVGQDSLTVVFNRLKNNFTTDSLLACQNPVLLDAGNKGYASYLWNDNTKNQTLSVSKEGIYSVIMQDSCKNSLTARIFVTFTKPTLNFPDTVRSCTDSLILNTRIGQKNATFLWSDGSTAPRLRVNQVGKYFVRVQTACGDILRDTVQAIFNKVPKVDFTSQISSTQGGSVVFTNNSTGEDTDTYLWDFGDGKTSTDKNPTYIFQQIGIFKVGLTVKSKFCGNIPKVEKSVNITVAGIENDNLSNQLTVYPNPSESGYFTLKHSLGNGIFKLRITDLVGRTWELPEIKSVESKLDLSALPRGLYLLEMQNAQYKVVKKLVLQ